MKLINRTIVMTGGSSGVGLDILCRLARSNHIINLSRSQPPKGSIDESNEFTQIITDLADESSVADAIKQIHASFPEGIDGLINCGAVQFTPKFTDSDFAYSSIAKEIAINLTSSIELTSGLLDQLLKRPEAFLLNVNSGLAIAPKAESAVYCATKAGLSNFTHGLRAQLLGTSVAVQQAFLPLVDTPMTQGRGKNKLPSNEVAAKIIAQIENGQSELDIGKVKLLRVISRFSPALANRIMQRE